jgi:hypothetical protein
MRVLIVYENVPESFDMYVLDVKEDDWLWLQKTHGNYINTDMPKDAEKACQKLIKLLEKRKPLDKKEPVDIKDLRVTHVIVTGFVM